MPDIVRCPRCQQPLQLPAGLGACLVRCPSCGADFEAPAVPSLELPPDVPPARDLVLERLPTPPPEPLRPRVVEVESRNGPSRRADRYEEDEDGPLERRARRRSERRRDGESNRGTFILVTGVLSLVLPFTFYCFPLGLIAGIVAWVMGHIELRKIDTGRGDRSARSNVHAGWLCGIIGTVINGLVLLGCAGVIGFAVWEDHRERRPPPRPGQVWPADKEFRR